MSAPGDIMFKCFCASMIETMNHRLRKLITSQHIKIVSCRPGVEIVSGLCNSSDFLQEIADASR